MRPGEGGGDKFHWWAHCKPVLCAGRRGGEISSTGGHTVNLYSVRVGEEGGI